MYHFSRWDSTLVCSLQLHSLPISKSMRLGVSMKTPYPADDIQNGMFLYPCSEEVPPPDLYTLADLVESTKRSLSPQMDLPMPSLVWVKT